MPRHTHPRPTSKHSRAHVRHQRERWIEKRWARVKSGETLNRWEQSRWNKEAFYLMSHAWRPLDAEELALAAKLGQVGPIVYIHPEVARALPAEQRRMFGTYDDNLDRWLKILPRRLSYRGSEMHPSWGWDTPLSVRRALDYRGKQRLRAEISEALADDALAAAHDATYVWSSQETTCDCHECYSAVKEERFAWQEWKEWGDTPEWERDDEAGRALRADLEALLK